MAHYIVLLVLVSVSSTVSSATLTGRVLEVQAGDSITLTDTNHVRYSVRLLGIDAPEPDQPWGKAARDALLSNVAGRFVVVEQVTWLPAGAGVSGKLVLGGQDVNLGQIRAGLAWFDRPHASGQPPGDRQLYEAMETEARRDRRGLWAAPAPVSPWEWRQRRYRY